MADCIDREAVVDYIRYKVCQGEGNIEHRCQRGSCAYCGIAEIMSDISCMPTADAQPNKKSQWQPPLMGQGKCETYCGRCFGKIMRNSTGIFEETPFCPHCGADMREADATKG